MVNELLVIAQYITVVGSALRSAVEQAVSRWRDSSAVEGKLAQNGSCEDTYIYMMQFLTINIDY